MDDKIGFKGFSDLWQANAKLALDTISMQETRGIPAWLLNDMQWSHIETLSGNPPGSYARDPVKVYLDFQLKAGACFIDQWIPENPLTMKDQGYDTKERGATTGAEEIIRDGMLIDSPEALVEHLEKYVFPRLEAERQTLELNADAHVSELIAGELDVQKLFGMNMLKGPYAGFFKFPELLYDSYGYVNYLMAYSLYPEVMEKCFKLQADAAELHNQHAARAIIEGGLPQLIRLDHDMADSRSTLVDVKSLDTLWFPHFARSIKPFLEAGIRLIWHCDGNLMAMVPRLIEAGISGFQGFQYEDGMDYEKICRMSDRNGDPLFIIAGVSVTRTLPHGKPADVKREMAWLVENGPKKGLMLGCSSSVAPGVPLENIKTLIEGFAYYREHGR